MINPPLRRFALLLWLLLMGAKVSTAAESPPVAGSPTEADLKAMLRDYIDSDKLGVGLVVAIVDEHGKGIVSDGDTLFEIGSVTKVFTGLLLQDMVDRGEMKLDDPAQGYLPKSVKMPTYHGKQITLLHLATHTSGFPREVDNFSPASWRNPGAGYTVSQAYDFLSHCKLRFEPGTKQTYSNFGVELLGHIIALKAGKDYETLVLERISPLSETTFFSPLAGDSFQVTFVQDKKGGVTGATIRMSGSPIHVVRVSNHPR